MAIGEMNLVLRADVGQAVLGLVEVLEKQGKVADGIRKINREGDGFSKIGRGILEIAGGFGIATSAIGAMHQAIGLLVKELEDMRRKETEAAQTTVNYAKSFSETIGGWLGAEKIDEAHAALTRLTKEIPTLSYTGGQAIFAAYARSKARAEIKPEEELARGIEVTKLVAPLTYRREETAKIMGGLEEIFPEKTMENLADIAIGIQKRAGRHKEEIEEAMKAVHRMIAIGIPREQALGTMMAAFKEEQSGRAMQAMAKIPLEFMESVKRIPGQPYTEEQKIRLETKGMTEAEIYNWALANPEKVKKIMGTSWAMIAPIMEPGR